MQRRASRVLLPLGTSVALHAAVAVFIVALAVRPRPIPQEPIQILVVDVPSAAKAPEPPPTSEAPRSMQNPVVITGITMESTSQGGAFVVGAGNTLRSAPEKVARDPQMVKPYKADQYAAAAQVNELPRPLNRDALNLRKYYPAQARKNGFEGDVVLRLLIDADGSIAKLDVVSDPGEGLGPAAAQAVRELRFSPAKVNGVAVATTVPFTIHFTLD